MTLHKLRIAWSVFWGLACVLLIVLWVRSYVYSDALSGPISKTKRLFVSSLAGAVQCRLDERKWNNPISFRPWSIRTEAVAHFQKMSDELYNAQATLGSPPKKTRIDFTWQVGLLGSTLFLPYCLLVLPTATTAVLPWIYRTRLRFTLRTLLIATTLIAVVLVAVIWVAR
jgi:hypothetical protein